MSTKTDPGDLKRDAKGREIADTPIIETPGFTTADFDQLESFANDPANSTRSNEETDSAPEETESTPTQMPSDGQSMAKSAGHAGPTAGRLTAIPGLKKDDATGKEADGKGTTGKSAKDAEESKTSTAADAAKVAASGFNIASVAAAAVKHRKKLIGGGGIAAFLIAIVLGLTALLPLKLEAIMKSFYNHEAGRMESYVERRATKMVIRYMYKEAINAVASDGVYTSSSMVQLMWGNMRKQQFVDKLYKEKGIRLVRAGPSAVRFEVEGRTIHTAANLGDLDDFTDRDLRGKQARLAIKAFTRDQTHWHQFLKRHMMRKFLRNAFNVHRWSIKKSEEKGNAKGPKVTGTEAAVRANSMDPSADLSVRAIGCINSDDCETSKERSANPDGQPGIKPPDLPNSGDENKDKATQAAQDGMEDTQKKLRDIPAKAIEKTLTKLVGEVASKAILKAVPVVGWIALVGAIDKSIWNGDWQGIGIALHSAQYVAVATTWLSLADQFKAGQLTAGQVGVLMAMLENMEKSAAFQRIFFDSPTAGQPIPDNKLVGSADSYIEPGSTIDYCDATYGLTHAREALPPPGSDKFVWFYRKFMSLPGIAPTGLHPPLCNITLVFDKVGGILGGVIGVVSKPVIFVIDHIPGVNDGFGYIMDHAQDLLEWIINKIWVPVYNGEWGPVLGNSIDAGLDTMINKICMDALGCQNGTYVSALEQNSRIAAENQAIVAQGGMFASLFNTDYPSSLGSRFLALAPATPDAAVNDLNTFATTLISNPTSILLSLGQIFSPRAYAAETLKEPNGVQQTEYPEDQLNDENFHLPPADIAGKPDASGNRTDPDGRIDQFDCPIIKDPKVTNPCLLDVQMVKALCSSMSDNDDGGMGGNGEPGPCGDLADEGTTIDTTTPAGSPAAGEAKDLAKQVLENPNIELTGRLVNSDMESAAAGSNASAGKPLSAKMLGVLLDLAKTTKIYVTAIESGGTGHSDTSNHFQGTAIDIVPVDGGFAKLFRQLYTNRVPYGLNELIFNPPPTGTSTLLAGKPHTYTSDVLAIHKDHIHYSTGN